MGLSCCVDRTPRVTDRSYGADTRRSHRGHGHVRTWSTVLLRRFEHVMLTSYQRHKLFIQRLAAWGETRFLPLHPAVTIYRRNIEYGVGL